MVVYPRFSECAINPPALADLQRAASLVGRTIAAMQVWDAVRAVRWALEDSRLGGLSVTVSGRGDHAVTALYAALFENRVQHTILEEPPASHRQAPPLLGVLRISELPEAAGFLAPRRLTLVGARDSKFDVTKEIYDGVGAAAAFAVANSLSEAAFRK